jgi:AcrR family transcriptional regulator
MMGRMDAAADLDNLLETRQIRRANDPPTRKGRAMRDRLLTAARTCFERNGRAGTGVPDITAEAGTSHGTFYRYFDSVDDVLLAALEPVIEELYRAAEWPRDADASSLAAIEAWFGRFLTVYVPHRLLLRTLREAAAIDRTGAFTTAYLALRERFLHQMAEWIQATWDTAGKASDQLTAYELADALGCLNEQLMYVRIGASMTEPTSPELDRLRHTVAVAVHRAVLGG